MRILFNNLIGQALFTSVHEDAAFPVENLASEYIRERYQVVGLVDSVTLTFAADVTLTDLFWGYTNVEKMQVTFKDSAGDIVDIVYFEGGDVAHYYGYSGGVYGFDTHYYGYYDRTSNHLYDPVGWHFDAITCRTIEIELEGPEDFYMGALGLGAASVLADPQDGWLEGWDDRSLRSESEGGHVLQQYVEPLRSYAWTLVGNTREEANAIRELYKLSGVGKKLWVDPFENNHGFMEPIYCSLTAPMTTRKNGKWYSVDMQIKEAR